MATRPIATQVAAGVHGMLPPRTPKTTANGFRQGDAGAVEGVAPDEVPEDRRPGLAEARLLVVQDA